MPFNDKIQDKIERYANGQMNNAESVAFKKKCETDKNYQHQWSSYLLLNAAGKAIEKKRFEAYDKTLDREKKRSWIIIGLLIISVIGAISYFALFKNETLTDEEQIFAEQYETPDKSILLENNRISTRKTSSLTNSEDRKKLQIAIDDFYNGDYERAILSLKNLTDYNTSLLRANFYIGAAQLKLGNYKAAIEEFENVLDGIDRDGNEDLIEETYWYQALAFVATNEAKKAIENLNILVEISEKYEIQAISLLKELK